MAENNFNEIFNELNKLNDNITPNIIKIPNESGNKSLKQYFIYGLVILVILGVIYYIYSRFKISGQKANNDKKLGEEKDYLKKQIAIISTENVKLRNAMDKLKSTENVSAIGTVKENDEIRSKLNNTVDVKPKINSDTTFSRPIKPNKSVK